jgi:low affinity Fe/Cu permease
LQYNNSFEAALRRRQNNRMKRIYRQMEIGFEKITSIATIILGNSITFTIALATVVFWLTSTRFFAQDFHECIRDVIHGVIFLSLFIIQKSFNRFVTSLHLKVNELVASHEPANNTVINVENKTEHEMTELAKEYSQLAELAKEEELS